MVAQKNTTLADVYFSDDDNMESMDTQVEAVTSWRQRLQPRWNGQSARKEKNPKSDASVSIDTNNNNMRKLKSIGSDSSSATSDVMQPAKRNHIFEDRDNTSDGTVKQASIKKNKNKSNTIIIEGMDTLENITGDGKPSTVDDTSRDPPKTYTLPTRDEKLKAHPSISKSKLIEFNGLNALENVLFVKLNSTEEKVVEQAAQELASQVGGDKENCEKFYHFGGYGALLATMTRFPNSAKVQGTCITVFSNVACHSLLCRNALVTTSVLYVVTQAMERFPHDALVQEMSLQFLWSFVGAIGVKEKFVDKLNGILLVTAAMEFFKDDVNIQKSGCQVLCKLSTSRGMKKQLKKTSAVVCVATALYKYPNECGELADDFMTTVFPRPSISKQAKRASVAFQGLRERAAGLKVSKPPSSSKTDGSLGGSSS